MNIWTKIFGSQGMDVAKQVGDVVDRFVQTPDEKIEAKKAMFEVFNQAAASEQKNITERWQSDMSSDNILSKTVRPAVLIFLILSTIVLIFIDSGFITFVVDDEWKELLKLILMTTVAAYFGGRSYEKGTKIKNK
jgi:cation transport ATPase|tara:strand:+ start:5129 stop:5533 length:405 start_codon:yes stop_codon:yes gene_type:complete